MIRKSRIAPLAAVLFGILTSFLLQWVSEVRALPPKPKPCGNVTCLPDEACCVLCPNLGDCTAKEADCPPRLPFCPPDTEKPDTTH
jgi:hypothetical protein